MAAQPDLTEFLKLSNPRRGVCPVALAVEQLGDPERVQLDAALSTDPGLITNQAIAQWFQARGHAVKWQPVASHRRRTCTCHD
jgi:hypothetical protein